MEPPNSTVPKVAETKQPIKVLHAVHIEVSVEAGPGCGRIGVSRGLHNQPCAIYT